MLIRDLKAIGVAHLDIKIDNIVITKDFDLKFIDFGMSGSQSAKILHKCCTLCYAPPELQQGCR